MKLTLALAIGVALTALACETPADAPASVLQKTVEGHSQQVLYTQPRFSVTATYSTGVAGFRFEDAKREVLGGLVETTSRELVLPSSASQPFTSAAYAQATLEVLLDRFRKDITVLLPQASPFEEDGDWSITPLETGTTTDVYGNVVAYGRYAFGYAPAYQLRSIDVMRYLSYVLIGKAWRDFPRKSDSYFASGRNTIQIAIGLSMREAGDFFSGSDGANKIGISFAAAPDTKKSAEVWDDLDDVLTFKTLGHSRDQLVRDSRTFEVPPQGSAVDFVIAVDQGGSMREEIDAVKATVGEFINRLATEATYDYRVAFVTQGAPDFVRLTDGKRYIDSKTGDPEGLADQALSEILATAETGTVVTPELLRSAALAVSSEALAGVNKSFRREGAPILLFSISDRDDRSPSLDGTLFGSQVAFEQSYASWLRVYTHWVPLVPLAAGCAPGTSQAALYVRGAADIYGADLYDWCTLNRSLLVGDLMRWGEINGSLFRFAAPQPFPFTVAASLNGKALKRGAANDYVYDVLGDRLVFSAEPGQGNAVEVEFYRLEVYDPSARH